MDWRAAVSAFLLVSLAEMGDKTQLMVLALASRRAPGWVWLGATLALAVTTGLAVLAAALIERWVPAAWIRWGAGALFVAMGLLIWTGKF